MLNNVLSCLVAYREEETYGPDPSDERELPGSDHRMERMLKDLRIGNLYPCHQ